MAWIPPKTDWVKTTRNNATDLNRQKDNVEYIAEVVLPALYYFAGIAPIPDAGRTDRPAYVLYNLLESNISAIESSGVPLPSGWEEAKTWVAGGAAPNYTDANRWERNVLLIYEMAGRAMPRFRPAGTFAAGQANILPRRVM